MFNKEDLPALAALLNVQQKLKAPKNQQGQGIKYKYRSAEQIFENLKDLLVEAGATLFYTHSRECENGTPLLHTIGYFADIATGASIVSEFTSEVATKANMDAGQKYGALASYNEKYIACSLFLIDNGAGDIDGDKSLQAVSQRTEASPRNDNEQGEGNIGEPTEAQIRLSFLKESMVELGVSNGRMKNIIRSHFKKDSYKELSDEQQQDLLVHLDEWSKEV